MASFAPLHTGQFVVKPRARKRRRMTVVLIALAIMLVPYASFEAGRLLSGYSIVSSTRTRLEEFQRIQTLETANEALQRKLNSSQIGQTIDQESSVSLQKSVAELQDQLQEQRAELTFYQSIVTPPAGASSEPQVQSVQIEPTGTPAKYLLRLVLIQPMHAGSGQQAQGTVQIEINGTQQGATVSLPLQSVTNDASISELKFAYRYFQTIEQAIELPADFQPTTVNVELHTAQHVAQRQSFGWQLQSKSDVTHHVQSS